MHRILVLLIILFSGSAVSASCALSKGVGFHVLNDNKGTLCLNNTNYGEELAKSKGYELTSFSLLSKDIIFFSAGNGFDSYIFMGTPVGIGMQVRESPSEDIEKNITGINSVAYNQFTNELFFLTDGWATSAAIHKINLGPIAEEKKVTPVFVTSGNSVSVVNSGKYIGNLIVEKHKYKDGGGSYDPYVLVTTDGKTIKELGEDRSSVYKSLQK